MLDSDDQVIAKAIFDEFYKTNYPALSKDEAFERFAMDLVLRKFGVAPADVEQGLVSGSEDGGIDGFYVFINGREIVGTDSPRLTKKKNALDGLQLGLPLDVVVVQAKSESSWDTNVFPKIESTLKAVLDPSQKESDLRDFPLNGDVIEKAMTLRRLRAQITMLVPVVRFYVAYVTFGKQSSVDKYMATKQQQLRKTVSTSMPTGSTTTVEYVGDAELVTRLRTKAEFRAKLLLKKLPIREPNALVGLVTLKDYLAFIRDEKTKVIRDEMFAVNVRDYAGATVRVNDAIGSTLSTDSESLFWWLNNGVTVIVDSADDPLELEWVLTNPLIVNGLQTSHVIHEQDLVKGITKKRLGDSVLVRVITESNPEVREAIISGTNNQTAIASLQLHANEEKQRRIEEFLRASGWYYERRRYQYRGTKVPAGKIRNAAEVGQAVMAYRLLAPDTARARPTSLLGTAAGWKQVFPPSESEALYLQAVNVVDAIDKYLRTATAKAIDVDATNARYYLTSGYVLRASGIKSIASFNTVPTAQLPSTPTEAELKELHALLYQQVEALDDKKAARDRLFKGSALKNAYYTRILKLNAS